MKRFVSISLGLLLSGLFIASCGESPSGPDLDPEPPEVTASFSVEPAEPAVGEEVTLDASASSVENAGSPSYDWSLSTPDGSDASLDDPLAEVATFQADVEGTYEVTLEVSAEGVSDSAEETVEATVPVVEISEDIAEDRTLSSDSLYRVTNEIGVTATLTIEPGTRIEFEQGTRLSIDSDGVLVAEGTGSQEIVLTGTQATPGWWDGLWLQASDSVDNVVEHAVVEYGGSEAVHTNTEAANVTVGRTNRSASVAVRSTTLRQGAGHGIFVHLDSDLHGFSENTITDNDGAAVRARTHHGHHFDAASDYTGNGVGFVDLEGGTGAEIDQDVTWDSLAVAFRLSERTDVDSATLSVEPGTEIAFRQEARLDIQPGAALVARGTPDAEITFTGTDQVAAWWQGIVIESAHPNNELEHVVIEYAGSEAVHANTEAANLTVGHTLRDAAVAIRNTTLRHGGGHGLYIHLDSDLFAFEENTLTGNARMPVRARAHHGRHFDAASQYVGNGEDFVELEAGTGTEIDQDVTWENLSVPYRISERIDVDGAEFTLEPGTELRFREEAQLDIQPGGALVAIGAEADSIEFTGSNESGGWWNGIFIKSTNPNNRIEYAVLAHGGREPLHSNTEAANLTVGRTLRDAVAVMANSTIRDSDGWGLWVHQNGVVPQDICVVNDFVRNAAGDCRLPPSN